ncbi:MAG: ribonuclease R, partial [Desulfofustis sp.]|nr:ribonuclease R [Desulfofustis sp.]
ALDLVLAQLDKEGSCKKSANNRFSLGKNHGLVEATVEMNQAGFGFGTDLQRRLGGRLPVKEPYIAPRLLHSALHRDRVLLAINRTHRDGRSEAEVIGILERRTKTLPGFYTSGKKYGSVSPEDPKFPFTIILSKAPEKPLEDGDVVIVSLNEYRGENEVFRGEITEVLGNPRRYEVQVRLVIEKFKLPYQFSKEAELQASACEPEAPIEGREDLRQIDHVTIDGEDAKDFDDAVAVIKSKSGFRLHVSIADVSAFIRTGSTLDQEAYERGTSIYLPGTVIPMLPEHLSNNLCRLLPDTDRLTLSAILDFDRQGTVKKSRFARTVIRSKQRFTYDKVQSIVADKDPELRKAHKPLVKSLEWAAELARLLQQKREKRGSINFTLPEAAITFGDDRQVVSIAKANRTFAHQIIEEFMLAANEAVAQTFAAHHLDLLYRIHEEPSPEKIADFVRFAATLGIIVPKNPGTPDWYNNLIALVKDTDHEYIVNSLLLRSMQQARYSPVNCGHFGLATDLYCHFTSPIRRYPDLMVHRLLCRFIGAEAGKKHRQGSMKCAPIASLKDCGIHLSERERVAIASERNMSERLKIQFMAERIGESFRAVISGVSNNGLFIELIDCFISGTVLLSSLTDDYYILDEKNHRFVGDVSCRILQIGMVIDVILLDVDSRQNKMFFTLKQTA